ncbi:MAG TPA: hypothetical protein VFO52_14240 [Longimicrobiales bacterium]|nr:hypothetical protein [Longimicrobiales bacterium]
MMKIRSALLVVVLFVPASRATAQLPWETPQLLAPHAPRGLGVLAASYAAAPGDGWGAVLTWRSADAPTGLGLRLAAGRGRAGENAIGGGIEASGWIARSAQAFPLDMIWTTGIGGSYGRSGQIALPMGIAAGRAFGGQGNVWFNPYGSARAIIEGRMGGGAPDDELDFQLATEIGANLSFDRNRRFILRTALALGDRSAFAIGGHLAGGRRADQRASIR